ncbi:MAG: hypothetical protein JSW73_02290 [Candidatus Woesearchaeota archaeon]|nr:MAG: hypothetical protein JSW73_02290 [Candidatus Woesearchaeota archaeon]
MIISAINSAIKDGLCLQWKDKINLFPTIEEKIVAFENQLLKKNYGAVVEIGEVLLPEIEKSKDPWLKSTFYSNLGLACTKVSSKNDKKALEYLDKSLEIDKEHQNEKRFVEKSKSIQEARYKIDGTFLERFLEEYTNLFPPIN